jgi:hypothetical protein
MKQGISMGTRRELVSGFAAEYANATKAQGCVRGNELILLPGWRIAEA